MLRILGFGVVRGDLSRDLPCNKRRAKQVSRQAVTGAHAGTTITLRMMAYDLERAQERVVT